ncbi:FadR/GntR family transcriptional regulator [Ruegeria sp. HKCCD7255]|uniref:FadR/GntR family transcriptional regulator n=1 Tax=Ruegeria sp. HKCCD7255 TaxID=2683004 RepID=UPI001488A97F
MSSPKVDQAINLVKELIQTGAVRPGDKLPNEAELATQLGVSRNSLREAVRAMQTMRILEARQGDGTYVSDLDPAMMMDVLRFAIDVSDAQSVVWFLELRRTLEMATTQEAAVRRTPAQLDELKALHDKVLTENDPSTLMALDGAFHDKIAEIGGNPVQAALLRVVSAPTVRARIWRQRLADHDFGGIRGEHQLVLDAIEHRDVEEARHAMWGHLSHVITWVRNNTEALANPMDKQ